MSADDTLADAGLDGLLRACSNQDGYQAYYHVPLPDDDATGLCGAFEDRDPVWRPLDTVPPVHRDLCPVCRSLLPDAYGLDPRAIPGQWRPRDMAADGDGKGLDGERCAACGDPATGRAAGVPLCSEWCEREHFDLDLDEVLVSDHLRGAATVEEVEDAVREADTLLDVQRRLRIRRQRLKPVLGKLGLGQQFETDPWDPRRLRGDGSDGPSDAADAVAGSGGERHV